MTISGPDFRQTWLWRQAFAIQRSDSTTEEQEFFRAQYLSIRDRAGQLVSRIAHDLPDFTVHDVSHLDALWDTASTVAEGAVSVNPAEAFVLGTSILLHDAGMSLAAYPGGLADIRQTIVWRDALAGAALSAEDSGGGLWTIDDPPAHVVRQILPEVLRRLHAAQAEVIAEQEWRTPSGEQRFLIEDADLRAFYGPTIGQIAHSHWWSVQKLEQELSEDLGAFASRTRSLVDRVKLGCLLRIADALNLDSRRAPRFLRMLTKPSAVSSLHWDFQERLARPHVELDAVVFTTGQPFGLSETEAWWLAYDTINAVDRELRDVDLLLQSRGREVLKARRAKGAGSPELLARTVQTKGWRPVDARLHVSDVPHIVEHLGGARLYGDDKTVALRELIQNAADAVQARRRFQQRAADWGQIIVSIPMRGDAFWLVVEDDGIGMSEQVLTGPLLDFGTSFWRSSTAVEEFPGLMAAGMQSIGRFGIGFFAVFMLGPIVRVYSRRCDRGQETGRLLEFRGGISTRPILSPAGGESVPIDGGTRVEVLLKDDPFKAGGLLARAVFSNKGISLSRLVGAVAPNLDVALATIEEGELRPVARPGDWLKMTERALVTRLNPEYDRAGGAGGRSRRDLLRPIVSADGSIFGRAFINPTKFTFLSPPGWVTVSGLRASSLNNVAGIILGTATTAARDVAKPIATNEALTQWASEQARLISISVADEERQAMAAEVVLGFGGDIGTLRVVKWGARWLCDSEFTERLGMVEELVISFDGEVDYDEDLDDVHPKEFSEFFVQGPEVAIVPQHDGVVLRTKAFSWPGTPSAEGKSKLAVFVRALIARAWGSGVKGKVEERVVGKVLHSEITREVVVFRRLKQE